MSAAALPLRARLVAHYADVAATRMADVPICNPALAVDAIGFDRMVGGERLGVLVTPWFMSAVLVPAPDVAPAQIGEKRRVRLPAGWFSFVAHDEPGIGGFWTCSLMSPVFELADQATAMAAAEAALDTLLSAGDLPDAEERAIAAAWQPAPEPEAAEAANDDPAEPAMPTRRALLRLRTRAD